METAGNAGSRSRSRASRHSPKHRFAFSARNFASGNSIPDKAAPLFAGRDVAFQDGSAFFSSCLVDRFITDFAKDVR